MRRERVQGWLCCGALAAFGLWFTHEVIMPAPVRRPRLVALTGEGPLYAELAWDYASGARPLSLIVDFEAGELRGSVTTSGKFRRAKLSLGAPPRGPYCVTVSATYRVLGFARTLVTRASGELPVG